MEIIIPGIDTSESIQCTTCGCEFRYVAGEVEHETSALYNVPEEYWKVNGGEYGPCGVRHYRFVTCPCCKMKCYLEQ